MSRQGNVLISSTPSSHFITLLLTTLPAATNIAQTVRHQVLTSLLVMKIMLPLFILLALSWQIVVSQGLIAELAAILGVLPTSQILLAGGGIMGIKLALLLRFLALVGLVRDHSSPPLALPGPTVFNATTHVMEATTAVPGTYFGLPDVLHHFGFGTENGTESSNNSTLQPISFVPTPSPTASPEVTTQGGIDNVSEENGSNSMMFDHETAYFPIPGLKIGVDNKTGKSFLLFDQDSAIPAVFMPISPADEIGQGKEGVVPRTNVSVSNITDSDQDLDQDQMEGNGTRQDTSAESRDAISYLYYPLIPGNVRLSSEEGFAVAANESQLLLRMANGSLIRGDRVKSVDFDGFKPTSRMRRSDAGAGVRDEGSPGSAADNIPTYFSLIKTLDVTDCFSRLICEIGANGTLYGRYGLTVGNFLASINASHYEPGSRVSDYMSRYHLGRSRKSVRVCSYGSPCHRDLVSLVEPLNVL